MISMQAQKSLKRFCTSNKFITGKLTGTNNNIYGLFINSPKNRNALSKTLICNLNEEIDRINESIVSSDCVLKTQIRAVYLMSSNSDIFCAGADLKERATMNEPQIEAFVNSLRNTFFKLSQVKVPIVCGVSGFALGGGLELAMSCDLRLVTANSVLGLTECSLGIIPGAGGTQRLSRIVGIGKAKELIFTSSKVNADEAVRIGLANKLIGDYAQLEENCLEICEQIASKAPKAVMLAKKAIDEGFDTGIRAGLEIEGICYGQIVGTKDRVEGMKAFLEKRKPEFKGI